MKILDPYAPGAGRATYQLECTGRKITANDHIIGINHELKLYEGYDGDLGEYDDTFTGEEQRELADFMIQLWGKYKDSII
jgi:hypothetical protein